MPLLYWFAGGYTKSDIKDELFGHGQLGAQVAEAVQHQNIVGASRVSEGDQSYVVDRRNPAKHLECIKYIKPCK